MYQWKHLKETSVIISNLNRLEWLKRCLQSIEMFTKDVEYELVIVDAGSKDGSREYLSKNYQKKATLIFEGRLFSYAQSNNRAMRLCREPYIALMNNDCEATSVWLRTAIDRMEEDKQIGHLAHKVLRSDGIRIMSHGANFDRNGNTIIPFLDCHRDDPRVNQEGNYGYAGFGVYRRDVYEKVGGLPEWPVTIYWDDSDYGLRVNALGLDVRYYPKSVIIHFMPENERSSHNQSAVIGRKYFMDKWGAFLSKNNGYAPDYPKKDSLLVTPWGKIATDGYPFIPLGWAVAELGVGEVLK
jgi:GT2 family glycosyltransferase